MRPLRRSIMKNWLPNSVLLSWLLVSGAAYADSLDDAHKCLTEANLPCAVKIQQKLLVEQPNNTDVLQLTARTLFHQGEFEEVVAILDRLSEQGVEITDDGGFPARASTAAFSGMVSSTGDTVIVRHDPGIDRVLVQDALQTMETARTTFDDLLGGGPEHDIVLDIFPTARRFMQASGIPEEAVRTTGVIALSKWNRLLITSPRATAGGYAWMDTAAHEYIHLVVSWRTKDQSPVWLQEGLARYLEKRWRSNPDFYLSSKQQSLLAAALMDESFVPFEKFRQSMAYLDSGEEAALAYAQVSTMVDFMVSQAGEPSLIALMDLIADGQTAEKAVSNLAGYDDFESFKEGWKVFLSTIPLVQQELTKSAVALDGSGGDFADDPVLQNRTDLSKFVRVGDLLVEHKRYRAALVEYQKANVPGEPLSPTVLSKMAESHMHLKEPDEAGQLLRQALELYPENNRVLLTAAQLAESVGLGESHPYWLKAHEINPFALETQKALIEHYTKSNQPDKREHHQHILSILEVGGVYPASSDL